MSLGAPQRERLTIRNARLIYRNFEGRQEKYNAPGDRNFSVMMAEEDALILQRDGWNVKAMRRREEDTEQYYHLKVKVKFDIRPPQIWLVSSRGRTPLGTELVEELDRLEYSNVDLSISPFDHDFNGGGRTAYLAALYFTMFEDPLALEYAEVPEILPGLEKDYATIPEIDVAYQPPAIESAARQKYDFDGDVVE